ncbi:hypothetical protein GCQ56_11970 [Marinifilum sp. N1E240]|uniref:DUF5916 domain-containing protein n=1 Tax=Marinifilum sp. N1E240 TaxID=2608082 RepID=UPI00128D706C|nr:DUF5916 domain-containing protein [Marinifilum sp. N1E240]MPQ47721.1 hypothetical protein [Marinifilum sp. N1E240]
MKLYSFILIILCCALFSSVHAKNKRKIFQTSRCTQAPKIDANLNDESWKHAPSIENFIQQSPINGGKPSERTIVKVIYDDDALYVGAMLYDSAPDSILTEYGLRDAGDQLNADLFSIEINPWNDSRTATEFMVSASGIQMDSHNTIARMNKSWDAVWSSKVRLNDEGWIVEMSIPYSALRFPKKDIQVWELNIFRLIKRKNEGITWNFVNKDVEGWLNQAGELHGIEGVEPKTRLSFSPYVSSYISSNSNSKNDSWSFKGGMDVKYGINESFTLDMMLIPDFGQVESDDQELNLSPFETFYDEKRSFFTEGTEIFNKGNIFYSRRLGGEPINKELVSESLQQNEIITENPNETRLINAVKISGRTNKGLGIGFINAVNKKTYAHIKDTVSKTTRNYLTQGIANYNMLVLDQSLGNQSYLSLANTHMLHPSDDYRSMVSATEFKLTNKSGVYAISGNAALSQNKKEESNKYGVRYQLQLSRIKGKFQFDLIHKSIDHKFDPNAMGYLEKNNEQSNVAVLKYNNYHPFGNINEFTNQLSITHNSLYHPNRFSKLELYGQSKLVFQNYSAITMEGSLTPVPKYDYYEPRVTSRKYKEPTDFWLRLTHDTDHRKSLALNSRIAYWKGRTFGKLSYWLELTPQLRVSDKLLFKHYFYYELNKNSLGFADYNEETNEIYFVNRDINTFTNTLEASWIFNQKASLSLRARHYWSEVEYKESYLLNDNGSMRDQSEYENHNHINYNSFNLDMIYTWEFAPGSELTLAWKNSVQANNSRIDRNYWDNFSGMFGKDQVNSLSLRLKYYIDYHKIKGK